MTRPLLRRSAPPQLPHACLPLCLPPCLPPSLPACLPPCLPLCLPPSLPACLPACPSYTQVLDGSDALAQKSWSYLNDASRLDLCLRCETRVIACASIHLAALDLSFPLPGGRRDNDATISDSDKDCQWWRLFGVELKAVVEVGKKILHLYDMPKVRLWS